MEFFKKHFDDFCDVLESLALETKSVSQIEIGLVRMHINSMENDTLITSFIEKCFPHLDKIKNKQFPNELLDFLRLRNLSKAIQELDDETKEDVWELFHEMIKSCILYIHKIKEYDGEKYTKRYFCKYKIKNLSEEWNVKLY